MSKMYNEHEAMVQGALDWAAEAEKDLKKQIEKGFAAGYTGREMLSALVMLITQVIAEAVMQRAISARRRKKPSEEVRWNK